MEEETKEKGDKGGRETKPYTLPPVFRVKNRISQLV
jgi:hypothetical protein